MANADITFGWVIYPVPRGLSEEDMATPTTAGRALMRDNERYIEALYPHFDTVWVEDHFQWEARPVLEAMTTLAYLAGRHEELRFGHIVLGQSYRNPALTAKMAANLQLMTGGSSFWGWARGGKKTSTVLMATHTQRRASASTNSKRPRRSSAPCGRKPPPILRESTTVSRTPSVSHGPTRPYRS